MLCFVQYVDIAASLTTNVGQLRGSPDLNNCLYFQLGPVRIYAPQSLDAHGVLTKGSNPGKQIIEEYNAALGRFEQHGTARDPSNAPSPPEHFLLMCRVRAAARSAWCRLSLCMSR